MAIPTVATILTDALLALDDAAGSRFGATVQTFGFERAYLTLADVLLGYEIERVKKVTTYSLPASTATLTPATASIADFGEIISLEERLDGSADQYAPVVLVETLPQADSGDTLGVYEWREDTFQFIASTAARQLKITYWASGAVPASGSVGIDNSRLFLAALTAAYMAPLKGDPERGKELKEEACGPSFDEGIVGGHLRRLLLPMLKFQQSKPVAPRPFSASPNGFIRRGRHFFIGPAA